MVESFSTGLSFMSDKMVSGLTVFLKMSQFTNFWKYEGAWEGMSSSSFSSFLVSSVYTFCGDGRFSCWINFY